MPASGSRKQAQGNEHNSKRPNCEEIEDRISSLPEELKTDIICRLSMEHALRTCILSKSWKRIFSSLPNLYFFEFRFPNVANRAHRFSALIDWTLANHEDSGICSLVIAFDILELSCPALKNTWVNFAVAHSVQKLRLTGKIDETGLPSSLFTCRSLVVLTLMIQAQILKLPSAIYLPNLKIMSLFLVIFPDETLTEKLFAGCPLLESLFMRKCGMFRLGRLTIPCPKLNSVCISECKIDKCIINLQRTCIETFHYDGFLARNFEFGNMDRLSSVVLNITKDPEDVRNDSEFARVAWNLLRASCHARELELSVSFIQVLKEVRGELWQLRCFTNLIHVHLTLWAYSGYEEMVMALLSKFHHVQKLHIAIQGIGGSADMFRVGMHPENYNLEGILRHLEHLYFDNFEGFDLEKGLLVYFLQNAKSLTRVTVRMPQLITLTCQDNFRRRLSSRVKRMIVEQLRQLRVAHPTVFITILDVTKTVD